MFKSPSVELARKIAVSVLVVALGVIASATHAEATVISFDDLPGNVFFPPAGYEFFQWGGGGGNTSWVVATDGGFLDLGVNENAHSGSRYVWANGSNALSMSDGLFDFNSFWVANASVPVTATARGFLLGTEIYTQQFNAQVDTYSFVTLNFLGIDSIVFDSHAGNLYMDDLTFSGGTAPVPEPASLLLVGTGAASLLARHRRRKCNA
jgi:hypothetical protein